VLQRGSKECLLRVDILNLFDKANAYAHHSRRGLVNARDVLAAQQESGWDISTLRNESKRRRMGE
jgi:histone H3/H4